MSDGEDLVAWLFVLVIACAFMYVPLHGHHPKKWLSVFVTSLKNDPIQTVLGVALYACAAAWFLWVLSWGSISTGWSGVAGVVVFALFLVRLKLRG